MQTAQKVRIYFQRYLFERQNRLVLILYLLLILLLFTCQTSSVADPLVQLGKGLPQSCLRSLKHLDLPSEDQDYYSWRSSRDFSRTERQAIESLSLASANVIAEGKSGYRNYNLPSGQLMQEQLLSGGFRTILPIRSIDGWNLFVLAQPFAPSSNYIRSFALLIEGKNGWQSRFLFPRKYRSGDDYQGNYEGGYDIAMYSSDLTNNGRKELLFVSNTGGTGGPISTEILQIVQAADKIRLQFESIELPSLHSYQVEFQDNFLVRVQLREEQKPFLIYRIPIAQQQSLGYDQDTGKWIDGNVQPWFHESPRRVRPVEWSCNNIQYNLLYTAQPLKGLAKSDNIGYFKSFWLLQTDEEQIVPTSSARQESSQAQKQADYIDPLEQGNAELLDSSRALHGGLHWGLIGNSFQPSPGNEVLEYESLLP